MSIKYNIIPHIRNRNKSNDMWTIFKDMYEMKNTSRALFLKSKLLSIKMEQNESINNFISRMKEIKDKLIDIGDKISSTYLVTITLNGMVYE